MNTRDEVLSRVRRNQPAACDSPPIPGFAAAAPSFEAFQAALERMGGRVEPLLNGDPDATVAALFPDAKVVASATPEVTGNRSLAAVQRPTDLDDVDVGVVRALFGVAETGSVLLTHAEFQVETLGFLAQHLVVLLDPVQIVASLHDAYRDPRVAAARYAIFMTGPSATADIEGVLIHGAQGVRSLSVIPLAARSA